MRNIRLKTFLSISSILLITILFHFLGFILPIENFLRSIIEPNSKILYNVSIKIRDQGLPFASADEFLNSYNTLKTENESNKQKAVQYDILREENFQLRKQLNFFTSTTFSHVGAEVIGKNIEPLANTLVLSRGMKDGVEVGNPVVALDGILIGKIFRVENDISIARLINDHQSKVAATVMNMSKSIGLVEGGYGISVRMNFVPQNELIAPGDTVITSGLEKEVPRGLIIGTVQTVEKEAYQPFQKAVLTPGVELDKVFVVSIITQSQPSNTSL